MVQKPLDAEFRLGRGSVAEAKGIIHRFDPTQPQHLTFGNPWEHLAESIETAIRRFHHDDRGESIANCYKVTQRLGLMLLEDKRLWKEFPETIYFDLRSTGRVGNSNFHSVGALHILKGREKIVLGIDMTASLLGLGEYAQTLLIQARHGPELLETLRHHYHIPWRAEYILNRERGNYRWVGD